MNDAVLVVVLLVQVVLFMPWLIYISRAWNGRADAAERLANAVLREKRAFRRLCQLNGKLKQLTGSERQAVDEYVRAVNEAKYAREEIAEALEAWEALQS